jgi:predicted signal transduction protein with EAL and GGDEF domain
LRNYRKDGSLFWNMLYFTPVRDPRSNQVTHFVGVQHDITEIKRYQEELEHQANHDALTGLANRTCCATGSSRPACRASVRPRCSVAFVDLDNFKLINDSLGHDVGDQVLKIVSERPRRVHPRRRHRRAARRRRIRACSSPSTAATAAGCASRKRVIARSRSRSRSTSGSSR